MANLEGTSGDICSAPPLGALAESWSRFARATAQSRSRRVLLLVIALWLLNIFDLICTMSVHDLGPFYEANPIARRMLQYPMLVVAYKLFMVAFATTVLLIYRRRRFVELACWCICTVYFTLGLLWLHHLRETAILSSFLDPPG